MFGSELIISARNSHAIKLSFNTMFSPAEFGFLLLISSLFVQITGVHRSTDIFV